MEIGGFIISGNDPKDVLIRARGPALASPPFNVPGTLANPFLQIFSGLTMIAQNDNWQNQTDTTCLANGYTCGTATQISNATFNGNSLSPCAPNPGQGGAPPNCSNESAILITLPAGAYTAIVSGVGGTSGVGLVEAFELP